MVWAAGNLVLARIARRNGSEESVQCPQVGIAICSCWIPPIAHRLLLLKIYHRVCGYWYIK
jgi:hypothetical protein